MKSEEKGVKCSGSLEKQESEEKMSGIIYKMSDLLSENSIKELTNMKNIIKNCGNDKLVVFDDYFCEDTFIYGLIGLLHKGINEDDNKECTIEVQVPKHSSFS